MYFIQHLFKKIVGVNKQSSSMSLLTQNKNYFIGGFVMKTQEKYYFLMYRVYIVRLKEVVGEKIAEVNDSFVEEVLKMWEKK